MSLINEALNRLEQEKSEEKPQQKSYPFSAPVKNLYDGNPLRKEPADTNNEYEQHDSSNNSGLAGNRTAPGKIVAQRAGNANGRRADCDFTAYRRS